VTDDGALVAAAGAGDRDALEQLLRGHYDRVHLVCRRITGNDADAADATQESLLAIVRGVANFDGRSSFATWAYRVTVNTCLDELRRRRRRAVPGLPVEETSDDRPAFDVAVADRLRLDDALARLPEEFRVAVVLRDVCDLDYAEIAAVLAIPPGTVRSRIARGRAALAQTLGGNRAPSAQRPRAES
jgi:RNA polymerase sigma-70 factor (ECF subfamily)